MAGVAALARRATAHLLSEQPTFVRQPDDVADVLGFQSFVQLGLGEAGVTSSRRQRSEDRITADYGKLGSTRELSGDLPYGPGQGHRLDQADGERGAPRNP